MGNENEKLGSKVGLETLWSKTEKRCAAYRSLARLVREEKFIKAYYSWSADEREKAFQAIEKGDAEAVKFMLKTKRVVLEDMTIRQLLELGKQLNIRGYTRLTRIKLIERIKEAQK